jgi:hypothetical protein
LDLLRALTMIKSWTAVLWGQSQSARADSFCRLVAAYWNGHHSNYVFILLLSALFGPLQTDCPNPAKIPDEDLLGATVVMVMCFYKNREFIRIGYWVANTYALPLAEGSCR